MIHSEVIVVGGGPAGSSCAHELKRQNVDCLVLDQRAFPRVKVCAGWVTPEVFRDLGAAPNDYPLGLTTFTVFDIAIKKLRFRMPTLQHAIRRYEFDDWLLRRSGVPVYTHAVKTITRDPGGDYILDGEFRAKYLVGAGGTHCPVYRTYFKKNDPRPAGSLIVAQEEEFQYPGADNRCRLWFLENGLPGYSWYVPKANGWVNVGIGGKAEVLKAYGDSLKRHWNLLIEKLDRMGLICGHDWKPAGHSYFLRERMPATRCENVLLAGDALGLATVDMGEGIGPAIRSGILAARAIVNQDEYSVGTIAKYSFRSLIRLLPAPPFARP